MSVLGFLAMAMIAIVFVLFLSSFIALRYLIADLSYARTVEEESPATHALEAYTQSLRTIEAQARDVLTHASSSPSFDEMARETLRIVPAGIDIATMRFEDGTFTIEGQYQHRSSFLAFLEVLRTHAFVKEVASPLSNLLKEIDAAFTVTVSL